MDSEKLLACPVCGKQPRRNGRLGPGGVLCADGTHRVQIYGKTQEDADRAWNTRPTPENGLREALEDFCLSAECAAGVDDGASEDMAASEIMSSMGSAMAVSYTNARSALQHNTGARGAESVEREIAGTVEGLPRDLRRAYVESNGNWQTVANAARLALSQAPR